MANRESEDAAAQRLRLINEETLMQSAGGQNFPIVTLPSGEKIPTGTVGALIINIKKYDAAASSGDNKTMEDLEVAMKAALPTLKKAGMFELFSPEEWIQGQSPGRRLVGEGGQAFLRQ